MSATPAGSTPGQAGYIRGGGGVDVNTGRLLRFLVVLCVLVLIALTVATAVSAANQNSRAAKLQSQGVPVDVTVTGCVGIDSGIAQAIQYYQCRGAYSVDGQRYNEVIGGVRSALPHRADSARGHDKGGSGAGEHGRSGQEGLLRRPYRAGRPRVRADRWPAALA